MSNNPAMYIWAYLQRDKETQLPYLALWQSPDAFATRPPMTITQFKYEVTNDEMDYFICSEVPIKEPTLIQICETSWNGQKEARRQHRNRPVVNRR